MQSMNVTNAKLPMRVAPIYSTVNHTCQRKAAALPSAVCVETFMYVAPDTRIEEYFKASYFSGENQMYCGQCDAKSDAAIVSNDEDFCT